ncbi:PH domain-containing protein [Nocardia transvalensis]|uniref:PH domain-containing protein n=1 Tax=Nocardia transvalensis TaxID=37333 RepID=UPI001895C4C5|nr:PH domain-containing protein [Nocardia transvalensis]MBF6327336.1 PH domain-containing protein [Nocardia transvalensis]
MAPPNNPGAPEFPGAQAPTIMAGPAWRPSSRAKLLWALGPAIGWVVVLIGELVWVFVDDGHRALQAAVVAVSLIAAAFAIGVVPLWRYAVHRWEVTDEAVYTRTGWFTQESRVAPITRVQTVDTQRGPLERLLGLATVTVTTASSAGAVRITALDLPVAERTVAQLTEVAAAHRGDAT